MLDTRQRTFFKTTECMDSPGDSVGKESACNARDTGDMGSVPVPRTIEQLNPCVTTIEPVS